MCLAQVSMGSLLGTGQPRPQGAFPWPWRWFKAKFKARVKRPGDEVGDGLVNYWPFFILSLVTVPDLCAKVCSAHYPRFSSGEWEKNQSTNIT